MFFREMVRSFFSTCVFLEERGQGLPRIGAGSADVSLQKETVQCGRFEKQRMARRKSPGNMT